MVAAVLSMCVVMLVTYTDSDLARGLAADGRSASLGGAMNTFPDTAFAQNVDSVSACCPRSRRPVRQLDLLPALSGVAADHPRQPHHGRRDRRLHTEPAVQPPRQAAGARSTEGALNTAG
ncbi:hypothetical protein [Amycolatopsis sp. cmx-11-51]|uniref:hypothetical protein n=1 Tax=unclassified Amycolatopsis TaxID=2618356 RepID=UPI0039E5AEFF